MTQTSSSWSDRWYQLLKELNGSDDYPIQYMGNRTTWRVVSSEHNKNDQEEQQVLYSPSGGTFTVNEKNYYYALERVIYIVRQSDYSLVVAVVPSGSASNADYCQYVFRSSLEEKDKEEKID
jgi:hypothetical protein